MINLANTCVLVRTQAECEKILEGAREQGYKWYGEKGVFVLGDQQFPDILKFYSDKTVVRGACPDNVYKLYEASELLGTKELTAREFIDWIETFYNCSMRCKDCVLNCGQSGKMCDPKNWSWHEEKLIEIAVADIDKGSKIRTAKYAVHNILDYLEKPDAEIDSEKLINELVIALRVIRERYIPARMRSDI